MARRVSNKVKSNAVSSVTSDNREMSDSKDTKKTRTASSRRNAAQSTKGESASKPAAKAAAKPARKSAAKVSEKPGAKVTSQNAVKKVATKTASKPVAKPASRPARASKAAAVDPLGQAVAAKKPARKTAKPASPSRRKKADTQKPATKKPAVGPALEKTASASKNIGAKAALEEARASFETPVQSQKLIENVDRIEALSHRLLNALTGKDVQNPGVQAPGPDLYLAAANAWVRTLAEQPARIIEQQVNFWGETLKNYAKTQYSLSKGQFTLPEEETTPDRRFKNPLWHSHPFFSFVRKQYLINADALKRTADDLELEDDIARRRVRWLTNQIIDMMAPTNFLATNPDALEKAVQTEGESLVKGLENLVRDVEQHGGEMIVSLADRNAFTVGENIGSAEGRVVHQTPLFELIQYNPTTEKVHETPLLIFPPWINKFYILDLKPQNSLIRWLVGQGHSLFVMSWKNPDASYAEIGMEEYVSAYLEAMDKVRDLTDQRKLNVVGYCIAGTTLSLTLALLNKRGDDRVNSATFFTTLTDFSEQGEFVAFLQNDFVDGIEAEIQTHGLLKSTLMSRTMSFLRANDLVWGPAVRSYMMGEEPPAFDLLFWNGDSTNLPGKMAMQYLRGLCQANAFAGDGFELMGHKLKLSDVQVPLCSVACEGDHIAPWKDCWRGFAQMGAADKTFILSESGHVAGVVNPPGREKYGHYTGDGGFENGSDGWFNTARMIKGSWWPSWGEWLSNRSGKLVDARHPDEELPPAPGSYVHERPM